MIPVCHRGHDLINSKISYAELFWVRVLLFINRTDFLVHAVLYLLVSVRLAVTFPWNGDFFLYLSDRIVAQLMSV